MASTDFESEETLLVRPPAHPVPHLQGPFEESMIESVNDAADHETNLDSMERRTMLLEMPKYERVIAGRWKQKPGERYHPLWKITAQMSFGMHLLAEGLARSEEEVIKILQAHVDDIDGFLERTTEDFDLAQSDVEERLRYLKLPLQHVEVFDRMLEDRSFRMSIVEGNEKIEHIVDRTSEAMKDSLKDVQKGLDATKALSSYLADLGRTWSRTTEEHEAVYVAMIGNVEGWSRAFKDLYTQGSNLGKSLVQLSEIVSEMQRRAGIVSRKMLIRPQSSAQPPALLRHSNMGPPPSRFHQENRSSRQPEPDKPLPTAPGSRTTSRPGARIHLPRQSPSTEKQAIIHDRGISDSSSTTRKIASDPSTPGSFTSGLSSPALPLAQRPLISELAGADAAPRTRSMPLTELPAEVPQRSVSNDPSSKLPVEHSDTIGKESCLPTPKSSGSATATSASASADGKAYELDADYFGPRVKRREEPASDGRTVLRPDIYKATEGLGIQGFSSNTIMESPITYSPAQTLPRENPAFISHPLTMVMATKPQLPGSGCVKPAELPGEIPAPRLLSDTQSDHKSSEESLKDSGPKPPDAEPHQPSARIATWHTDGQGRHSLSTEPANIDSVVQEQPLIRPSPLLEAIARRSLKAQAAQDQSLPNNQSPSDTRFSEIILPSESSNVAEMEGSSPVVLAPLTFAPVELEAPEPRLALPARSTAATSPRNDDGEAMSAAITSQSDFFKLPTIPGVGGLDRIAKKLGTSRHQTSSTTSGMSNLKTSAGEPSRLPAYPRGPAIHRKEAPRQIGTNLIDRIADTPPESPIHTRSISESSMNSARLIGERPSRLLAPPDEAPPPPAPGGRSMVTPDYASAGAFDGERKSNRGSGGSGGSGGSWKKIFSSLSLTTPIEPLMSRPGSSRLEQRPGSSMHSPDMMTAGEMTFYGSRA